ncbi:MAG TPA: rhodanese-like domain-containing protein [candidate division Zixibacteria bacterium]
MTTSGAQLFTFSLYIDNPKDLTNDSTDLWLVTSDGKLFKYNQNGEVVDSIIGLLSSGWGLTWENKHLWVSDPSSDSICEVRLPQYKNISTDSVKNWIESGANLVMLDVRELYEFESYGRIPDAINLPWNSGVLDTAYTRFSLDDTIIVVCHSGNRSVQASNFLDGKGFQNVYNMLGGMNAWHYPVEVGGRISENVTWGKDKSPFIAVADIVLDSGKTLTLEPGVNLEFDGFFSLDAYGNLIAQGTLDSNINFTSYNLFSSRWEGISIFKGSNSYFTYCRIDSIENGILCLNSSPIIENSWIIGNQNCLHLSGTFANPPIYNCKLQAAVNSSAILILCDSSSAPTITYCSIMDGLKGMVSKNGSNPKLNYDNIYNNNDYGVLNEDSSVIVDAKYNWWGHKSGPFDPVDNPDGQGNQVSQRVDYIPWLQIIFPYVCGDANSDSSTTVSDVVYLINYLFKGGPAPDPIQKVDVNSDGKVTVSDVVYLINYLFKGGPAPCS